MVGPVNKQRLYPMPTLSDVPRPRKLIIDTPPFRVILSPAALAYVDSLKKPKPIAKPVGVLTPGAGVGWKPPW